jgi:hypothetical protein
MREVQKEIDAERMTMLVLPGGLTPYARGSGVVEERWSSWPESALGMARGGAEKAAGGKAMRMTLAQPYAGCC